MDQVEEVKSKIDIVALISEHVPLKKAGRNFKALCPFHSEKTPSFMVSPELQIFKCFGCGRSGDAISFLEELEGMEFIEALRFLADRAGVRLEEKRGPETSLREKIFEVNKAALDFYHYILLKHQEGANPLAYLIKERGLKEATIKTFKIGYCPDTAFAARKYLFEKKGFKTDDLVKAAIVYPKGTSLFDRMRGRVVFPLMDHRGNVAGFSGRILPDKGKDLAKYINSPETPAYHKSSILFGLNLTKGEVKAQDFAVVVEGELDLISTWQAGIKNTVALKGSSFTEDQVRLIKRFTKKVTLALDADLAGDEAARRGIKAAQEGGLEVRVARLEAFKDPDEAAQKDPQALKKMIEKAVGVWDFIIDAIFEKHETKSGLAKERISREVVPVLTQIDDTIVQAHYVNLVATRLKVPPEAVARQIERMRQKKEETVTFLGTKKMQEKGRRELLEERLLSLAFQTNPGKVLTKAKVKFETPLARRIVAAFKSYLKNKKKFALKGFAKSLAPELVEGFSQLVLKDVYSTDSPERLKEEVDLIVKEIEILDVKRKLTDLSAEIIGFEKKSANQKSKDAQAAFARLSETLSQLEEERAKGIIF